MSPRWRKRWIAWHLTVGALLAPYAAVYGVSSLLLSHPDWAPARNREWREIVEVPPAATSEQRAVAARDALGLVGSVPPWRVEAEADGRLRFRVVRPGRVYDAEWDPLTREARVRVRDGRLPGIVAGLHGLHALPGSFWGVAWGAYTQLSLLGFPFLIVSGFLLEGARWRKRPLGAWLAVGATLVVCVLGLWLAS